LVGKEFGTHGLRREEVAEKSGGEKGLKRGVDVACVADVE
jgi:hypothetical protein